MKKTKRAAELQPKDRINFYKNSIPMTAEIYRVQEIGGQVVVECCGGHTLYRIGRECESPPALVVG